MFAKLPTGQLRDLGHGSAVGGSALRLLTGVSHSKGRAGSLEIGGASRPILKGPVSR